MPTFSALPDVTKLANSCQPQPISLGKSCPSNPQDVLTVDAAIFVSIGHVLEYQVPRLPVVVVVVAVAGVGVVRVEVGE